jgi:tRNA A37 methylthiotransferase MiaB
MYVHLCMNIYKYICIFINIIIYDHKIHYIGTHPNICASLHLPVQSGSNSVLTRMRRGYTREVYLELVASARQMIPNLTISTDIITGEY